jgi:hypothetical protein
VIENNILKIINTRVETVVFQKELSFISQSEQNEKYNYN